MLADDLDATSRGHVDDFRVAYGVRTVLRTHVADQLFTNRLADFRGERPRPSFRLRMLSNRSFVNFVTPPDLPNGKLTGAVFALDRFPVHNLALGHARYAIRQR